MDNRAIEPKLSMVVPTVINLFQIRHQGKGNAIKGPDLLFHLKGLGVERIDSADIRSIIGHIRYHDLVAPMFILSNVNTGYWLSSDAAEQDEFITQELNRMTNQYGNIRPLHKRIKSSKGQNTLVQQDLFNH